MTTAKKAKAGKQQPGTGNTLQITITDPNDEKSAIARIVTGPSLSAARIVQTYSSGHGLDLMATIDQLSEHQRQVKTGDLSQAESMLMNQATVLL